MGTYVYTHNFFLIFALNSFFFCFALDRAGHFELITNATRVIANELEGTN